MTHAFQLDGLDHELWLSRSGNGYQVHIGEVSLPATLVARSAHVHELTVADVPERVVIACRGDDVHIHLDGETYLLRYSHGLERFASRPDEGHESVSRAPMPGAVISVAVEPGAAVTRGQALLVIESMKMETTIAATCDGTVQAVHVTIGQTFDRDAPLVTLERIKEAT
jgi:biotin carboxyl carrier protein